MESTPLPPPPRPLAPSMSMFFNLIGKLTMTFFTVKGQSWRVLKSCISCRLISREKNSCKEILYLAKKAVPTLKKISLLAYDSGKNPTARPLYVRKKKFYHQRVWGKTFFPRQITHTTHSPSMSNGRLFLLFLCCSGPLFRSLPNVPLFLCSSCFVPC